MNTADKNRHKASSAAESKKAVKFDTVRVAVWGGLAVLLAISFFSWTKLKASASRPDPQTRALTRYSGRFKNELLYNILKRDGVNQTDTGNVLGVLAKQMKAERFRPADRYDLDISTSGVFHRLSVSHNATRYYVAKVNGGRYLGGKFDIKIIEERRAVGGVIKDSLWNSLASKGFSPRIIMEFADVFAWNVDFLTETRDGDRFAVIWDERRTDEGTVLEQRIIAAAYDGRETGLKEAYYYAQSYFGADGEELKRMFLRAPLTYRRISSYFTNRRMHPVLRIARPHLGIDYAAPTGTPVSSVANGVVTFAGRRGGFGNFVEIRHADGYVSTYGHLSRFSKYGRSGVRVTQGEVVGYVGSTGLSTGPHLDFRIKQSGSFLNFLKIKNRAAGKMVAGKLSAFRNQISNVSEKINALLSEQGGGKSRKK
ncbi:MAG: M23 family metallopeptidase [Elusimicrobiaceae bacterium]|jgi:murein DD-endopeptidase MepM/ murein hydrolase activator NlpD